MNRILVFFAVLGAAQAQVSSSSLLGEVRDESSALIAGARITARQETTGFSRTVITSSQGAYRIDELLPGRYTVTAEKQGFRTFVARSVVLEVNQKGKLDIEMRVGSERDSVTVSAAVSPLQTDDASVGYYLGARAITNLPLAERNVISLVTLGPGAIPRHLGGFTGDVVSDVQGSRGAVGLNPPINGARSTMNSFLLDGAVNADRAVFAMAVNPPMDAVEEFRIQSALPSAETAQGGGGVIDLVTKAGGLNYHGSAFEYFRNEAADAHNFFDDPALPRPIFRQNQFGGSLGGRLPFPSAFFFVAYEGLRGKDATPSLSVVPDQALRSGDFRGRSPIYDPLDLDPVTRARRPFANNLIPADRIDPIARKFLDRYEPLPNRAEASSNYLDSTPDERAHDLVSGRIDKQSGRSSRWFGRYTLNDERDRVFAAFPLRPTSERVRAQQAALGHTFARGAWLNEARLSFTRLRVFDVPENAFRNDVTRELGVTGLPADPLLYGLPFFLVTNFSTVTDSPALPKTQRDHLWQAGDAIAVARGRHTAKLGFQWIHFHYNYLQSQYARGQYTFTGAFTAADPRMPGDTGDAFADFLLGFPQITQRNVGATQAYLSQNAYAGYAQDDWRVSSRLTVNLGLRYEYGTPYREARNNLLNLDYSTLPAPPRLVRVNSAVEGDRNDFAPRVGLAWRPFPQRAMVFRAGYGVYFSSEIASETYDLIRNGIRNEINSTDGTYPLLTLRDGFPQTASTGFPGYFGLDPKAPTPYVQQWTASIQQQLPQGVLLEAAYVGTKGTRLGRFRRFNTPPDPGAGDLQARRPFPELGTITQRQHISNSIYHALELKTERRFTGRVSFLASFVWAKSIDDSDNVLVGLYDSFGAQDERNLRLERGLSFFDVGRRVSAGFLASLPRGRLPRLLFANWQLSGIVTLQDGTPVNPVYFAADIANTGTPNRPNIVPGQAIELPRSQRTADHFFNTDAFATPAPYTFGNAGRNIIPGPGNNLFDLALNRRFPIGEAAIQFRAEFFNAFNHPNWGIPGPYPDFGPFFAKIFSTGQPRRIQFALRYDF